VLKTNDESADVLLGITRATAIQLASDLGIEVCIAPIELDELLSAEEVFFTGTAAEIMPIAQIDARRYPSKRPVTDALRAAYSCATRGEDPVHADWSSHYVVAASRPVKRRAALGGGGHG
jgi:branched-chain amino acid aminotransferase